MHSDTYQRTLEYVQSCQNWMETNSNTNTTVCNLQVGSSIINNSPGQHNNNTLWPDVSSSTHPHPSTNMIINDMTTSLSSLLEENRLYDVVHNWSVVVPVGSEHRDLEFATHY